MSTDDELTLDLTDGPVPRLVATGTIDALNAWQLQEALERARGTERLELDLGGVTFMDSAGLRALILGARSIGRLDAVAVSLQVERLLDLTGLAGVLNEQRA